MTQLKHTPEPWQAGQRFIKDANYNHVANVEFPEAAARIVQCVNACAGMEDPANEIAALREQNLRFKEELKRMLPVLEADGLYTTGHWIRYIIGEEEL